MKKELNIAKVERDEVVLKLIDETFLKLSCSMNGIGMYQEIRNAIKQAYRIGKTKRKKLEDQRTIELVSVNNTEAQQLQHSS